MTTADELAAIRRRYPSGQWVSFTDQDAATKLHQALTDIHTLQAALDAATAALDLAYERIRRLRCDPAAECNCANCGRDENAPECDTCFSYVAGSAWIPKAKEVRP